MHVYFNGHWGGSFTANTLRNDVGNAYPAFGAEHGFTIPVTVAPGSTQVCVFALSTGDGSRATGQLLFAVSEAAIDAIGEAIERSVAS